MASAFVARRHPRRVLPISCQPNCWRNAGEPASSSSALVASMRVAPPRRTHDTAWRTSHVAMPRRRYAGWTKCSCSWAQRLRHESVPPRVRSPCTLTYPNRPGAGSKRDAEREFWGTTWSAETVRNVVRGPSGPEYSGDRLATHERLSAAQPRGGGVPLLAPSRPLTVNESKRSTQCCPAFLGGGARLAAGAWLPSRR